MGLFLPSDDGPLAIAAGGGLAVAGLLVEQDEKRKPLWLLAGGAVALWGFARTASNVGTVLLEGGEKSQQPFGGGLGGISAADAGGGLGEGTGAALIGAETAINFMGRLVQAATGINIGAKGTSEVDLPAVIDGGPFLGHPKNIHQIAGAIRFPQPGSEVRLNIAARTYQVDTAVENQGNLHQRGELWLEVTETPPRWWDPFAFLDADVQRVSAGVIDLAPRQFRSNLFRVPLPSDGPLDGPALGQPRPPGRITAKLRFGSGSGHLLATTSYERESSLI